MTKVEQAKRVLELAEAFNSPTTCPGYVGCRLKLPEPDRNDPTKCYGCLNCFILDVRAVVQ